MSYYRGTIKVVYNLQLEKVFGANDIDLKWKMLEIELEKKLGSERERLNALGIFGLVLCLS